MKCPVCLDAATAITTACGHAFCATCIETWVKANPTCPMCRAPLNAIDACRATFRIRWRSKLKIRGDILKVNGKRYHYSNVRAVAHGDRFTILYAQKDNKEVAIRFPKNDAVFEAVSMWFHTAAFYRQNEEAIRRPSSAGR